MLETHIHPTAIISPKAMLEEDVKVGPYSLIGEDVHIGRGTVIGPHVQIEKWTTIGEECKIFFGATIGNESKDLKYDGWRSYVKIGNRNILREYVSISRSTFEEGSTIVGDNNLLRGTVRQIEGELCKVAVGDVLIEAFMVEPLEVGASTVLAIRPERVELAPEKGYANTMRTKVEDMVFQGDHWRIRLDAFAQPDFFIKIPNLVGQRGVLPGDQVTVGWTALDCRAVPDEG